MLQQDVDEPASAASPPESQKTAMSVKRKSAGGCVEQDSTHSRTHWPTLTTAVVSLAATQVAEAEQGQDAEDTPEEPGVPAKTT